MIKFLNWPMLIEFVASFLKLELNANVSGKIMLAFFFEIIKVFEIYYCVTL